MGQVPLCEAPGTGGTGRRLLGRWGQRYLPPSSAGLDLQQTSRNDYAHTQPQVFRRGRACLGGTMVLHGVGTPFWKLFMRRMMSYITGVLLLLHAVFGCCWHHAHTCPQESCDASTACASLCPNGTCSHEADHSGHHDDRASHGGEQFIPAHQGQHPHPCDGATCVFLPTDSPRTVQRLADRICVGTVVPMLSTNLPLAGDLMDSACPSPCATGPPIRTHLVHQVLLI